MDEYKENTQCEHCAQQVAGFAGQLPYVEKEHVRLDKAHHDAVWSAYHHCRDTIQRLLGRDVRELAGAQASDDGAVDV